MAPNYLNISVLPNGNLQISFTTQGEKFYEDWQTDDISQNTNDRWNDLLESYSVNGSYSLILPEHIGALTTAPIIIDVKNLDDNGDIIIYPESKIWYFADYMVIDEFEKMYNGVSIEFTLLIE